MICFLNVFFKVEVKNLVEQKKHSLLESHPCSISLVDSMQGQNRKGGGGGIFPSPVDIFFGGVRLMLAKIRYLNIQLLEIRYTKLNRNSKLRNNMIIFNNILF